MHKMEKRSKYPKYDIRRNISLVKSLFTFQFFNSIRKSMNLRGYPQPMHRD